MAASVSMRSRWGGGQSITKSINFDDPSTVRTGNLANSAVLRALEEEERQQKTDRPSRQRHRDIDRETVLRINRRHRSCDYPWPPKLRSSSCEQLSIASRHFDDSLYKEHQIDNIKNIFDHTAQHRKEYEKTNFASNKNSKMVVASTNEDEDEDAINDRHNNASTATTTTTTTWQNEKNNHNRKKQTNHLSTESYMCNKVGRQYLDIQHNLWTEIIQQQDADGITTTGISKKTFYLPDELLHRGELDQRIHHYLDGIPVDTQFGKPLYRSQSHEILSESMHDNSHQQQQRQRRLKQPWQQRNFDSKNEKRKSQSFNELPPVKPKRKVQLINANEQLQQQQHQQQQGREVHGKCGKMEDNHNREEAKCIIKNQFDNNDINIRYGGTDRGESIDFHKNNDKPRTRTDNNDLQASAITVLEQQRQVKPFAYYDSSYDEVLSWGSCNANSSSPTDNCHETTSATAVTNSDVNNSNKFTNVTQTYDVIPPMEQIQNHHNDNCRPSKTQLQFNTINFENKLPLMSNDNWHHEKFILNRSDDREICGTATTTTKTVGSGVISETGKSKYFPIHDNSVAGIGFHNSNNGGSISNMTTTTRDDIKCANKLGENCCPWMMFNNENDKHFQMIADENALITTPSPSPSPSPPPTTTGETIQMGESGILKALCEKDTNWNHLLETETDEFLPAVEDKDKCVKRVAWPPPPDSQAPGQTEPNSNQQGQAHTQYQPQATQGFRPLDSAPVTQQQQQQQQTQPREYQIPIQIEQPQAYPGYITPLRKEAPISQVPAPVYASQPVAASYQGGINMRGDQKWPPEEVKKQSEIDNEQRKKIAQGPVFRPKRVAKDYSQFFAQHALNSTYPGYRAPPGTQHIAGDSSEM